MPWGRLDDSFYDHPKIEALGRDANAGAGVLMRAVSWSNRWLTDGRIPAHVLLRKFGAAPALVAAMVAGDLLEKIDPETYLIHDFGDYNDLRDEVEERRRETHEARVRAGQARARSAAREGGRFTSTGASTPPADLPAQAPARHQHGAGQPAGPVVVTRDQHATSTPPAPSESRPIQGESRAPTAVPARGPGSPVREPRLTKAQLEAWASFTAPEWQPFREAWLARGFRHPPSGSRDDDDTSQRGLLWQIANNRPDDLGRWVTAAIGKTPREVIDWILAQWHEVRAEAGVEDERQQDEAAVHRGSWSKAADIVDEIKQRTWFDGSAEAAS